MKLEQSICYGSRQAVMQNLIDAGCSKDMIDDLMKQLAEELIAQLKERRIEHQEYLTIGCAPGKVETPLFHLNAEDVAR